MSTKILYRIALFVVLLLLQILVFNHIHLLGFATPLMVVYYLVLAPNDEDRSLLMLQCFLLGLAMDISTSTPGMAAAALTLSGLVAPRLLSLIATPDRPDDTFTPSAREMGWGSFMFYASVVTLVFVVSYYLIAWFTFSQMHSLLLNIAGSTLLTLMLIAVFERVHYRL
ncbi:MAG: rod shape-determining protein MreD [Bacteroidaceae bacterium]|nr:rod shape-determining protein MreD [Bacteroidaceae bacterium]